MNTRKTKSLAAALFASAILGLGLAGCGGGGGSDNPGEGDSGSTPPPAAVDPVRATEFGQVEGSVSADGNTVAWLGVPFAKPPVGPLRWQATQPPDAWTGVRPAKEYAEPCMQIGGLYGPPPKGTDYSAVWQTFFQPIGSEDCLYLNIWSPTHPTTGETKLPVVFYIHGGSNVVGSAIDAVYVGNNLANSANAVVVTVAYRLGLFGWFAQPSFNTGDPIRDSGNFAVLDMIQALKFVKNNIANFGGDPDSVTIMGQSAGSTNVNALITSPLAAGLFHKAVSLSGGIGGSSMTSAVNKSNAIINALLIKDHLATDKASADAFRTAQSDEWIRNYMMAKSGNDLYGIQVDPTGGKWQTGALTLEPGSASAQLWGTVAPIADGTVEPTNPTAAVRAGNFNKVPLIVGNTSEEGKLFTTAFKIDNFTRIKWMNGTYLGTTVGLQLQDVLDDTIISPLTPENYAIYAYNNANRVNPGPSISTAVFLSLANSSSTAYYPQVPIYAYSFNWNKEPAPWDVVYGAWHSGDLPFLFGNYGMSLYAFSWSDANKPGRLALADAMQKSLAAFIRTGDPNNSTLGMTWPQWTPTAPQRLQFDATLDATAITVQ